MDAIQRVAVVGAGRVGTAVARALLDAGFEVSLSGSGDAEIVSSIAAIVAPGTVALRTEDAVAGADLVVLAVPLHRLSTLDPRLFRGKVVVDAMNYWPPVDGALAAFENTAESSSEVVRRYLQDATIVKTFNHTGYHDLEPDRRPAAHPERLGIAVAGDDSQAVEDVAGVIDRIGYDAVVLDSLAAGRSLQPGGPVFGGRLAADAITHAIGGRRALTTDGRSRTWNLV